MVKRCELGRLRPVTPEVASSSLVAPATKKIRGLGHILNPFFIVPFWIFPIQTILLIEIKDLHLRLDGCHLPGQTARAVLSVIRLHRQIDAVAIIL